MELFCECGFKRYTRVEVDSAVSYCTNCQKEEAIKNGCISKRIIKKDTAGPPIINAYTKFDVRLPRMAMPCTNKECKNTSIIYIRSNETDLKYCFLCPDCNTQW